MNIRAVLPGDYEAIADLVEQWQPGTAQDMRSRLLTRNDPEWVAEDEGRIIGWIRGHHEQTYIWRRLAEFAERPECWRCSYITQICVDHEHRGQGIGSALLRVFEQAALSAGNSLVVLNPDASEPGREQSLHTFYGKNGYYLPEAIGAFTAYLLAKNL